MPMKSERAEFTGSLGEKLAGRLELPFGRPRAFALFAHCFTCSKDVFAASRIAGRLSDHGIAVLRFDFTGLGHSDGEFANTDFTSNVGDLVRAADFLRDEYEAPALLIGHSLGGAAVLAAAGDIPQAKVIATIGAPADTEHVVENFAADLDQIERDGAADVKLAGRTFRIRKEFVENVRSQNLTPKIRELRRPLMIFHAPLDATVGISNAEKIFLSARHPKSFVSLDQADHLLSRREDAMFVADTIAGWSARYLGIDDGPETPLVAPDAEHVTVVETGNSKFENQVITGRHVLHADEPLEVGGTDTGPGPYQYLGAALGACTSMTMRMYAERKGIPAERFVVRVAHDRIHREDCAACAETDGNAQGLIDVFDREIQIVGELDDATRQRLMEIADKCPVHRTLENKIVVRTTERR